VALRLAGTDRRGVKNAADVVAILDEAKRSRDYDPLERLLFAFMKGNNPHNAEIVQEALIEIARKLREGEPTILLGPQLGGILKNCGKRVRERMITANERLALTDNEQFLDVFVDEGADPALVLDRLEDLDAKIELLSRIKERNPRQFAVHQADYQRVPVNEYFQSTLGETITAQNARKLRERGKKTFEKELQRIRKDTSL
jgi:hypothetical protein